MEKDEFTPAMRKAWNIAGLFCVTSFSFLAFLISAVFIQSLGGFSALKWANDHLGNLLLFSVTVYALFYAKKEYESKNYPIIKSSISCRQFTDGNRITFCIQNKCQHPLNIRLSSIKVSSRDGIELKEDRFLKAFVLTPEEESEIQVGVLILPKGQGKGGFSLVVEAQITTPIESSRVYLYSLLDDYEYLNGFLGPSLDTLSSHSELKRIR